MFQFKDYARGVYLSNIFLKNVKTNKIYKPRFELIYNPENEGSGVEMMFDFFGMSPRKILYWLWI